MNWMERERKRDRSREIYRQENGLSHYCTNSSLANTLESVVSNECVSYTYQPAAHQLYKLSCEQVEDWGSSVSCLQYVFLQHTKCSFSAFPVSAVISKTFCPPIRSRVTWKCVCVRVDASICSLKKAVLAVQIHIIWLHLQPTYRFYKL